MKLRGVFLGAVLGLGVLLACGGRLVGQPPAEDKASYVGAQVCAGCHQDLAKEWDALPHARVLMAPKREVEGKGCEECHGPGSKHVAGDVKAILSGRSLKPAREAEMCLRCHRTTLKPQEWHGSVHAKERLSCTTCHTVHHAPKGPKMLRASVTDQCLSCHPAERAQFRQNSHHPVLEGRVSCLDCHDPHRAADGRPAPQQASERCTVCHTDKAGPFLYEHDASSGDTAEGCATCHRSHGSPNPQLQRIGGRGLCHQCHFDRVTHNPGRTCWAAGCHSEIHGSHRNELFLR